MQAITAPFRAITRLATAGSRRSLEAAEAAERAKVAPELQAAFMKEKLRDMFWGNLIGARF